MKPYISCTLGNARLYRERGGQELDGKMQLFLIMVMMVMMMTMMMVVMIMVMKMIYRRMASESWYNMVVTNENFSQLNS